MYTYENTLGIFGNCVLSRGRFDNTEPLISKFIYAFSVYLSIKIA